MKKALSLLLVVVMICSTFAGLQITSLAKELSSTGWCGDNVSWSFNSSTGQLTIKGNGYMRDYDTGEDTPASPFSNVLEIKKVIINTGVKSIGDLAFMNCENLNEVTIPSSVEEVGRRVFEGCNALSTITVDSNNSIYDSRNNCNAIIEKSTNTLVAGCKNSIIPSTVVKIGHLAFSKIETLTNIIIPSSVSVLEGRPFSNCSGITKITVNSNNKNFDSRNSCNAIIEKSTNTLLYGCKNTIIPNTVKKIGSSAFSHCSELKNISIPNSVTYIDSSAFERCTGLKKITIPGSVTSIGEYEPLDNCNGYAFSGCTGLEEVVIEDGVQKIGERAFHDCSSLKNVTIPQSVTTIGGWAFSGCDGLETLTILNRSCYLYTSNIDSSMFIPTKTVLCGYSNSSAESYAQKHNRHFVDIEVADVDTINPTGEILATNDLSYRQEVTLSFFDDNKVAGYYWGNDSDCLKNPYRATTENSVSMFINSTYTYYLAVVDTAGNVSVTKSITFCLTTLNANGGSVSPTNVLTQSGKSFTFPTPTRSGYTYQGWSTTSSATSGVKSLTPNGNTTYYAVWKQNEVADTTKPTGSISSTNNVADSQTATLTLSDNKAVAGYYWGTNSNYSSNNYTTASAGSITKTVSSAGTYYLTVKDTSGNVSDTVSITYYKTTLNANGGSVSPTSVLTQSGKAFTFPTPTKSDYTYHGWSTLSTATSGVKILTPNAGKTYYAVWLKNDSTKSISETTVFLSQANISYDGAPKKPMVIVKDGDKTLVENTDYVVVYSSNTNIGVATAIIVGIGEYSGRKEANFNIICEHQMNAKVVKPTATNLGYTEYCCSICGEYKKDAAGKSIKDNFTAPTGKLPLKHSARTVNAIKVQWNTIKTATGYQVQISNAVGKKWSTSANLKAGVTNYTFKKLAAGNNYKFRLRFYITAADGKNYYSPWSSTLTSPTLPSGTTLTKLTPAKKAFTAQWKKAGVTGYQIQYSTSASFSGAKKLTIKNAKNLKATVKSLSAKKTYYVRIRTYKTISKVNYFSTWSKTYKVKTK